MNKNYKISVIIPVYNSEAYLSRLFNSLMKQSFEEFEVIAIDDGSKDKSLEILRYHASHDKRIKVFTQKNMGQSVSRNRGITLATSPYICFVDSDDAIEEEMLQALYATMLNDKSDIVTTSYKTFYLDGTCTVTNREIRDSKNISNPALPSYIVGQLYKKSLFQSNNIFFPEGVYFEDQLTALELYFYAGKISTLNTPLYNYYINSNSTTQKISEKKIDDIFSVIELIECFLAKKKILNSHKTNINAKLLKLVNNYILNYLISFEDQTLFEYFFHKLIQSNKITKTTLDELSSQHFGLYFDFVTKMVLVQNVYRQEKLDLKSFIDSKALSFLNIQYAQTQNLSFAHLALNYLQENDISKIVIYGYGKVYQEIRPLLEKNAISVVAIIDSNQSLQETMTLEEFLPNNANYPFLITSIAFAPEIEKKLTSQIGNPHIISVKSLFA